MTLSQKVTETLTTLATWYEQSLLVCSSNVKQKTQALGENNCESGRRETSSKQNGAYHLQISCHHYFQYLRFYFRLALDELRENKRNCLVCTLTTWRCKKRFSDISYFISQGFHGIEEEVFLSLPCVLGSHGIICVIKQTLDESEAKQLQECAHTMHEIQESLQFWAFSGSYLCDCKFYLWRWQSHCVFIIIVLSKDKIDQTQLAQVVYHLQIIIRCL